jgi:uncharacterized protein YegL
MHTQLKQSQSIATQMSTTPVQVQIQEEQTGPAAAVKDMNVIFVQDVSGSMDVQRISVANGINEIIGDLQGRYKAPCEYKASISIIQFSSHDHITIGPAVPVQEVPRMSADSLKCDGMTALWDAAAIAIERMNTESAGVPATTYIFTDGDNNDSKKHTKHDVQEMIATNKKNNPMHSVLFIGSDPSTKRNAHDIGLDRVHSIHHDANSTPVAYEVCRRALGRCVSGDTQSTEFNNDDIMMSETPHHDDEPCTPEPCTPTPQFTDSQISDDDYAFASDDVPSAILRRAMSSRN